MTLEERIRRSIAKRPGLVILRSELAPLGSSAQVGRVLTRLVNDGKLVRVSQGAFAKTRINKLTGKLTAAGTLEDISAELFNKLGVTILPCSLVSEYNSGTSTQLPMSTTINTGRRRISRKVVVGGRQLSYEGAKKTNVHSLSIPTHNVGSFVRNLAKRHHVTATKTYADAWAEQITSLAGDDVQSDEVESLAIALKKANKVTGPEMVRMLSNYLREKTQHV